MALQFTEREFIPVLLGGDINAYSVARAFYEEYQVKSLVFGKYQTGPAYRSQIIDYTPNVDIDTMPVMLKTVNGIAQAHADKTIVLVGCGDNYVALVAQAKDAHELADNIVAPYAPYSMLEQCQKKEIFYELCEKHGVPYPHTFTFTMAMLNVQGEAPAEVLDQIDFPYPMILKPSDGIMWWQHEFEGQKKAYEIADRAELEQVIRDSYASGYTDDLILQDRVPGNDEYMRVLTSYSDRNGKVRMMCLGHAVITPASSPSPTTSSWAACASCSRTFTLWAIPTLTLSMTSATARLSSSISTHVRAAATTTSPTAALTLPSMWWTSMCSTARLSRSL